MKLSNTIKLFCTAAGGQTTGSDLTHPPGLITDTPKVRDIVRKRLVRPINSPDVDAEVHYKEQQQKDNAAFTGKPFRTVDTKYGHYIGEYDSEEEANQAALARPYTRVLKHVDPSQSQDVRDLNRKAHV